MSFLSLIVKNLLRQPVRAGLTLLGISVGITTVVALGVVTGGMKKTAGEIITSGGADFLVAQKGAADMAFSTISEKENESIAATPGVERAIPVLLHIVSVGSNPYFMLSGWRAEDLAGTPLPLVEGALPAAGAGDELLLGAGAASDLGASVGATVTIAESQFRVVGIYRTGALWEDNGARAPLATVQAITAKPGTVSVIYVALAEGARTKEVASFIEERFPNLVTITSVGELSKVDQGVEMMDAANLAISILAVGIGAIGVMNTMVMSVFERTREIGILRAVGWSGARVLRMIIIESLALCLVAAGFGAALGVAASRAVLFVPAIRSLLEPVYTVDIFIRALVVATAVALVGAAYPAYRAVRLTPMEALRYE